MNGPYDDRPIVVEPPLAQPPESVSRALEQVVYKIHNAEVNRYPFPHLVVPEIFPRDFYSALLRHIPSPDQFIRMQNSRHGNDKIDENRFFLSMKDGSFDSLPEDLRDFWTDFGRNILSAWFYRQVLDKFRPYCDKKRLLLGRLQQECLLVSDRRNFVIKPHTDTSQKLFSMLFYLPQDDSLAACGTAIYRPRDGGQKFNSVDYFDFEGFHEVMRVPFLPNTLFAFVRTHNSFHGVPVIETFGKSRNLLIFESFALRPF